MMGKEQYIRGMWQYFSLEKARVQTSRRCCEVEAGRGTRPMAIRVSRQRSSCTSPKKCRYRLHHQNDEAGFPCHERREPGGIQRKLQGRNERDGMGPQKDTCRMCARIATAFLLRITFGGSQRDMETATTGKRSVAVGGVRCVEASTNGERPTEYWWYRRALMPVMQRSSKRTRRHKVCVKT